MCVFNFEKKDVNVVTKRVLLPSSPYYLKIKNECLRGLYYTHFLARDFLAYDNAEKIYLYEYISFDLKDIQQAYITIANDLSLFKNKKCTILFNLMGDNLLMDAYEKVTRLFDNHDMILQWGIGRKVEIKFLCC